MLSPKNKTQQTRRYVCTCRTYECFAGRFIDADGISQQGVELSRSAFEAHHRAELRCRAQAKPNPGQAYIPLEPSESFSRQSNPTNENALVSQLDGMVLGSTRPVISTGSPCRSSLSHQSSENGAPRPPELQPRPITSSSRICDTREQPINTSEGLLPSISASQGSIQPYNCGTHCLYRL